VTIDAHTMTAHVDADALNVQSWSVTLDETWSPFIQATIVVTADEVSRALDPRDDNPPRVSFVLEQRFGEYGFLDDFDADFTALTLDQIDAVVVNGDGDTVDDLTLDELDLLPCISYNAVQIDATRFEAELHVRRRRMRRDGTIELVLASDEGLLLDMRGDTIFTDDTLVEFLQSLLDDSRGGTVFLPAYTFGPISDDAFDPDLPVGQDPLSPTTVTLVQTVSESAWEFLNKVADTVNARVWADESGAWRVAEFPLPASGDPITVGVANRMRDFEDVIDRDEWNDYPIARWRWVDEDGVSQEYLLAPLGTAGRARVAFFDFTGKPAFAESDGVYPYEAVAGIGLRAAARARDAGVTAVADYTTYPGRPIEITLPDEPVLEGVIRAVTFTGPTDPSMQITTRDIEEA
jgi:hypothetical protein